jgi:HK97 family phage major capsid protein/HK97 family phage prohead protease
MKNRIPCNRVVEFRATESASEDDGFTLEGYAAVFDTVTRIRSWEGEFDEKIARGAFKKTLKDRTSPVIMQYDHGKDVRVGSVPIGSYTDLREDNVGLPVIGRLFDNDTVLPVRQAIAAGAITGMSFKFEVLRDEWRDNKGKLVKPEEIEELLWSPGTRGPLVRTVKEIKLYEAGPVSSPAYATTSVGVRSGTLGEEERGAAPLSREEVIESYKRSMYVEDDSDEEEERLQEWLDAENEYRTGQWLEAEAQFRWLEAETEYRNKVSEWLDAETANIKARSDAAPKGTSRTQPPKRSAARKSTPRRESTIIPPKKKDRVMTLEELRALIAEMTERQSDIEAEHRDAELPEDVQAEFDEAGEAIERASKSIERIEARQKRVREAAERGDVEKPGAPYVKKNTDNIYKLDEIRKESFGGDDFIVRAQEAAKHVLERANMPAHRGLDAAKEDLAEMIEAGVDEGYVAKRMVATGSPAYERAFGKAMKYGSTNALNLADHAALEEARAIAIGSDAAGNFAVPFQLDPTLVHLGAGYVSPIRQLAKVVQLYGKEYQTLTISQIAVYRALEAAAAVDSSPTLAQAVLRVNKVHGFVPFSMEADEDWNGMRTEIFSLLQEAKDREEALAFMFGNGTAPNPQGLLTGLTNTVAAGSGLKITAADIYKLMEALPVEFEQNASFVATKATYNKIRQMDNTTAGKNSASIWGPDLEQGKPARLLDTPTYRVTDAASPVMDFVNGNKVLIYGDIRKAFTILDRIGMSVELIPMLFTTPSLGAALPTGQRGFYAHWRNNSKVVDANAARVLTATT